MNQKARKGILLAGGAGSRLYPCSTVINKQLLPVYDKPMIYYSLSVLMLSGIREILLITLLDDIPRYQRLLKDGSQWGLKITYAAQSQPRGVADAFLVAESFIAGDPVCLVLGDNIFYGDSLPLVLEEVSLQSQGALLFAYQVADPRRYGVVTFSEDSRVLSLEEKPSKPQSNFAVPGLYYYDHQVVDIVKTLKPSARGELEVTDLNRCYLEQGNLSVKVLGRGVAWLDAGTPSSLLKAANFIQVIEERQGLKICCPEEIAWRYGFIDDDQFKRLLSQLSPGPYVDYLRGLLGMRQTSAVSPVF